MTVRIMVGNALSQLALLPDDSVHCVVTSPPYWGLRSYKGDAGMIGLEPTFADHLDNLVAVFREVRRVLRSDGSLWLNYGDAYGRGEGRGTSGGPGKQQSNVGSITRPEPKHIPGGLKPKDLLMMPARVAMALQADGWWLRSEIIWHKRWQDRQGFPRHVKPSMGARPHRHSPSRLFWGRQGVPVGEVVPFAPPGMSDAPPGYLAAYFPVLAPIHARDVAAIERAALALPRRHLGIEKRVTHGRNLPPCCHGRNFRPETRMNRRGATG